MSWSIFISNLFWPLPVLSGITEKHRCCCPRLLIDSALCRCECPAVVPPPPPPPASIRLSSVVLVGSSSSVHGLSLHEAIVFRRFSLLLLWWFATSN
uniref:Secreted protein n=1 Tax=Globodera rostochiensis TaxID=31243 RepID=A0A914GSH5_GLORO